MLGAVAHIGITVRDMEKAIHFYRDLLGLKVIGDVTFAGDEADILIGEDNSNCAPCISAARMTERVPPLSCFISLSPSPRENPTPESRIQVSPKSPFG